ncbi:hypothetical protein VIMY103929_17275 [Vibrio mytili]
MTADLNLSCSLDPDRVNFASIYTKTHLALWITLFIEIIHWLSKSKKNAKQ